MKFIDYFDKMYWLMNDMFALLKERLPMDKGCVCEGGLGDVGAEGLMTVREAYLELNVSRSTIDNLRKQGLLKSIYQGGHVRLIRSEVLAAKRWYSQPKGKL